MVLTSEKGLEKDEIRSALKKSIESKSLKKVLLLPPDATRLYSGAGMLCNMYYNMLKDVCEVDVMPALGTHEPMTKEECASFFGDIPYEKIIAHDWKKDVVKIGEVPGEYVKEVSEGLVDTKIDVEVNKRLVSGEYDLIISMGQVVPHEVVGMANYSKNIFVGCGGSSFINSSHMLGAFYGMERIMGKDFSPVRKVFDYAEEKLIQNIPLMYVLTVTTNEGDKTNIHGLFIGRDRKLFEQAVAMSREKNFVFPEKPLKKVVVYLDGREFKSTWLGNKAVYRTRMAISDRGQLIILAPNVSKFGEDAENDRLIRKFGYVGREKILELVKTEKELQNNLSVAAHLIHGSSDGRFDITYCTEKLSKEEVEGVAFNYAPYKEMAEKYDISKLKDGFNTVDGEEIYYISNPALGLWATKDRL